MSNRDVIRAWKNPAYRNSLRKAERSTIPDNPAGTIEISDEDLGKVAGGEVAPLTGRCTIPCSLGCPTVRAGCY